MDDQITDHMVWSGPHGMEWKCDRTLICDAFVDIFCQNEGVVDVNHA